MPSTSSRMVMAKAASLGAPPISSVAGRRRALVDVGHPHVEGRGAELEAQAGDDEDEAEDQHLAVDAAGGDGFEDLGDLQRAGGAVHHAQAVEQEAAGQRAEHEVLHRRLGGHRVVAAQRGQRVQRQAHQFQAQVDDQEVVGRAHHRDAQQHEQRERGRTRP
jgi:hypothetical protein